VGVGQRPRRLRGDSRIRERHLGGRRGPVAIVAGLVVALLAVLVLSGTAGRRKTGIATLVISAVSLLFVFGNYSSISKDVDSAPAGVTANIGIGLIFAIIGGIMAAIASIALIRKRS
jgi:hypothetical protein